MGDDDGYRVPVCIVFLYEGFRLDVFLEIRGVLLRRNIGMKCCLWMEYRLVDCFWRSL